MLKEQITADIKVAMKAGDSAKLTVLRGLSSVISNKTLEKRSKTGDANTALTDEEILTALGTEAKRRKESATAFVAGGRQDLADNELAELKMIQVYLPVQMTAEETEVAVNKILATTGLKEFGPAMKAVMAELRGKADSQIITSIIKKQCQ
jgi:hypothetical protein